MIKIKQCSRCKQELSIACFNKHIRTKDGLRSACRECEKTTLKKRLLTDESRAKDRIRESSNRNNISDSYIKKIIWRENKGTIAFKDISHDIITERRKRIIAYRLQEDERNEKRVIREQKEAEKLSRITACVICSNEFHPIHPDQKTCSDECKKEEQRRCAYERNKAKKELNAHKCKECGRMFIPEYGDKKKIFCSEYCRKRYTLRVGKATRDARERGNGHYESFDPFDVFKRDKWICQLCHIKTPRKLRGTIEDNAPELDHIIPLAQGGEHSMRNTQCLCRKCNGKKGASIKGQLRLFG